MSKKQTEARPAKHKNLYTAVSKLPKSKKEELAVGLCNKTTRKELDLTIPVTIFIQDPMVAKKSPKIGLQEIDIDWEPGLYHGPTSARIAVVDYDADTNELFKPVRWDRNRWCFVNPNGKSVESKDLMNRQFHQMNVWGVIMKTIDFYENPKALGRSIPWAFEGNRLIVVPHAGYGENAFYDRRSKSLQFYYCGTKQKPIFTCLSHDIIAHETGHAILDGIRSYYNECSSLQTSAFHEFMADLTAILVAMRNNDFRHVVAESTKGDLTRAKFLANLAEQFSKHVIDREYLRSALNKDKMDVVKNGKSPHFCSQVLTGTMFKIMTEMAANYMLRWKRKKKKIKSAKAPLYNTIDRFMRVALQPLDYCPPVDIQFEDYVNAVLRRDQLTNPQDPHGYRQIMRKEFKNRQIPHLKDEEEPDYSKHFCYNIDNVSSSRIAAYHFIHEKRELLYIPENQDIVVNEPYSANKVRRANRRLPREIVLQYIWREEVELKAPRFGPFRGEKVSLLCGGTLVYDDRGNLLYWCRKSGTQFQTRIRGQKAKKREEKEREKGKHRKRKLLDYVVSLIERDMTGLADEGEGDSMDIWTPIVGRRVHGTLRLEATPSLRHWGDGKGGQE